MILNIRVIPRSSRSLVKKENDRIKVYLTQPAQHSLANNQLIKVLAKYLGIKKYQISIIKGEKSRDKLVKIDA